MIAEELRRGASTDRSNGGVVRAPDCSTEDAPRARTTPSVDAHEEGHPDAVHRRLVECAGGDAPRYRGPLSLARGGEGRARDELGEGGEREDRRCPRGGPALRRHL